MASETLKTMAEGFKRWGKAWRETKAEERKELGLVFQLMKQARAEKSEALWKEATLKLKEEELRIKKAKAAEVKPEYITSVASLLSSYSKAYPGATIDDEGLMAWYGRTISSDPDKAHEFIAKVKEWRHKTPEDVRRAYGRKLPGLKRSEAAAPSPPTAAAPRPSPVEVDLYEEPAERHGRFPTMEERYPAERLVPELDIEMPEAAPAPAEKPRGITITSKSTNREIGDYLTTVFGMRVYDPLSGEMTAAGKKAVDTTRAGMVKTEKDAEKEETRVAEKAEAKKEKKDAAVRKETKEGLDDEFDPLFDSYKKGTLQEMPLEDAVADLDRRAATIDYDPNYEERLESVAYGQEAKPERESEEDKRIRSGWEERQTGITKKYENVLHGMRGKVKEIYENDVLVKEWQEYRALYPRAVEIMPEIDKWMRQRLEYYFGDPSGVKKSAHVEAQIPFWLVTQIGQMPGATYEEKYIGLEMILGIIAEVGVGKALTNEEWKRMKPAYIEDIEASRGKKLSPGEATKAYEGFLHVRYNDMRRNLIKKASPRGAWDLTKIHDRVERHHEVGGIIQ